MREQQESHNPPSGMETKILEDISLFLKDAKKDGRIRNLQTHLQGEEVEVLGMLSLPLGEGKEEFYPHNLGYSRDGLRSESVQSSTRRVEVDEYYLVKVGADEFYISAKEVEKAEKEGRNSSQRKEKLINILLDHHFSIEEIQKRWIAILSAKAMELPAKEGEIRFILPKEKVKNFSIRIEGGKYPSRTLVIEKEGKEERFFLS